MVDEQWEFLKDVALLIQFAEKNGFVLTAGEMWRTAEQQEIYVKSGKSKTMNSQHLNRLAVDFNHFKDGKLVWDVETLRPLGEYWQSLNAKNSAGMFWKFLDTPHYQRK